MTRMREADGTGSYEPEKPNEGPEFPGSSTRHGTPSGWTKHVKAGENPCNACSMAKAHYDWRWKSSDANTKKNRLRARAQSLALAELRRRHSGEYDGLYRTISADMFREAGFEPPAVRGRKG